MGVASPCWRVTVLSGYRVTDLPGYLIIVLLVYRVAGLSCWRSGGKAFLVHAPRRFVRLHTIRLTRD